MARMVWLWILSLVAFCDAQKEIMKFKLLEEVANNTVVRDISKSLKIQVLSSIEGKTHYYFLNGSLKDIFRIDSNGLIRTTAARIDRESRDTYEFYVIARKGDNNMVIQAVEIKILDVNDHTPKFTKQVYVGEVKEYSRAGKFILNVIATDKDIGTNGELVYSLQIDPRYKELFMLDARTGELRTNAVLDYEFSKDYKLQVTARDKGPGLNSSVAMVIVKVSVHCLHRV